MLTHRPCILSRRLGGRFSFGKPCAHFKAATLWMISYGYKATLNQERPAGRLCRLCVIKHATFSLYSKLLHAKLCLKLHTDDASASFCLNIFERNFLHHKYHYLCQKCSVVISTQCFSGNGWFNVKLVRHVWKMANCLNLIFRLRWKFERNWHKLLLGWPTRFFFAINIELYPWRICCKA